MKQTAPCMFCGMVPCECNGPVVKKTARKPKAASAEPEPVAPVKRSLPKPARRVVKVDLSAEPVKPTHMQAAAAAIKAAPKHAPLDIETELAVRTLAGAEMLHASDLDTYADIIHTHFNLSEWRKRHG